MPRPPTCSDETILDSVGHLLAKHGPDRLTLAHVGQAVGLSAAAILQRFGSRQALLVAFAAREAERLPAHFAARRGTPDPRGALIEALQALVTGASDSPERIANGIAFLAQDIRDPALREHAAAHLHALRMGARALLADAARVPPGPSAGRIRSGDTALLAEVVIAAFHGILLQWALAPSGECADAVARVTGAILDAP